MFKCQICGKSSKKYERPAMLVRETRAKEYALREHIYGKDKHDPGGVGLEIVKEIRIHVGCVPDETWPGILAVEQQVAELKKARQSLLDEQEMEGDYDEYE